MAIACVAPGAAAGVMLNVSGLADRPVATGTVTVQDTAVVVPDTRVTTTLGVVPVPATTLALVGLQATEKSKIGVTVNENCGLAA